MKIFVVSFNRATSNALGLLIQKMKDHNLWTSDYKKADFLLVCADRIETHTFALECFKENQRIIHLWSGEVSCFATHDDSYRWSITSMAEIALCTNTEAKHRVEKFCKAIGKKMDIHTVGNVYLDSLEIDPLFIPIYPKYQYDVVLYNPVTRQTEVEVINEINEIKKHLKDNYLWIESNGDRYSEFIKPYVTHKTLPRITFLSYLKYCRKFITNSSCQFFEAPFVMDKKNIVSIGKRNAERESKHSDMTILNASDNIIKILEGLK